MGETENKKPHPTQSRMGPISDLADTEKITLGSFLV